MLLGAALTTTPMAQATEPPDEELVAVTVDTPPSAVEPAIRSAHNGAKDAVGIRFRYSNVTGEFFFQGKNADASFARFQHLVTEKYGSEPRVTGVVEMVPKSRAAPIRAASQRNTTPDAGLPTADVTIKAPSQTAPSVSANGSTKAAGSAWFPSFTNTQAFQGPEGREIKVQLEWADGKAPGAANWANRGLEFETNLLNGHPGDRVPVVNACPNNDDDFWSAGNAMNTAELWAFETNTGATLPYGSEPYFDTEIYSDPCSVMSQTVGIGRPGTLPEQQPGSGYWLFQTRVVAETGRVPSSAMSGAVDPVSHDCVTDDGPLPANSVCMGVADAVPGSDTDVLTELMLNRDRGFLAPGCVSHTDGGRPDRLRARRRMPMIASIGFQP